MANIGTLNLDFRTNVATLINDMRRASGAVNSSARSMERSFKQVQAVFRGLVGVLAVKRTFAISDELTTLNNKLRLVSQGPEDLKRALEGISQVSQRTLSSISATATLYSRLAIATKDLNISQNQLLKVTEAVNNTFRISGSTTQEAAAAAIQLAQGLASGALKGDELRSVLENNARFGQLLAKELNTNVGALRDMAAEGKITAEVVAAVLLKNFEALRTEAGKITPTFAAAGQVIRDQFSSGFAEQTAAQFNAMTTSIAQSGNASRQFGIVIGEVVNELALFFTETGKVLKGIADMAGGMETFAYVTKSAMNGAKAAILIVQEAVLILTEFIISAFDELNKLSRSAARVVGFDVSAQTGNEKFIGTLRAGVRAVGKELVDLGNAQNQLTKDFKDGKLFENFRKNADGAQQSAEDLNNTLGNMKGPLFDPAGVKLPSGASGAGDKEADRRAKQIRTVIENLQFEYEQMGRNARQQELYNQLRAAGTTIDTEAGQRIAALVEMHQALEKAQKRQADIQADLQKRAQQGIEQHMRAFNVFNSVVEQGLRGQIKSWKDLGAAILSELQNILVAQYQMQATNSSSPLGSILGSIFGLGGPKLSNSALDLAFASPGLLFARGGISNKPAIFGEAGPEAAVPLPDGRSIPVKFTGRSGGGGTYYIDARGADSEGLRRLEAQIKALNGSIEHRALSAVKTENARNPRYLR